MTNHRPVTGAERRRHPRLPYNLPLKISADEVDIVTETQNLSCCGALCRVNSRLDPMTKLKVCLLLPMRKGKKIENHQIKCMGVVVRSQLVDADSFTVAIFFHDISARDAQAINDFVQHEQARRNA